MVDGLDPVYEAAQAAVAEHAEVPTWLTTVIVNATVAALRKLPADVLADVLGVADAQRS